MTVDSTFKSSPPYALHATTTAASGEEADLTRTIFDAKNPTIVTVEYDMLVASLTTNTATIGVSLFFTDANYQVALVLSGSQVLGSDAVSDPFEYHAHTPKAFAWPQGKLSHVVMKLTKGSAWTSTITVDGTAIETDYVLPAAFTVKNQIRLNVGANYNSAGAPLDVWIDNVVLRLN